MAWSPDSKRLVFGGSGLHVWDVEFDKESFQYAEPSGGAAWSPDGRCLAFGRHNNAGIRVIDVAADAKPRGVAANGYVAWSPDGKTITTIPNGFAGSHGWVRLYDSATGNLRKSLSEVGIFPPPSDLSLDGQTVAVCENGQTTLASVDTGSVRTVLEDTKAPVALSPDGRRVVTGGPDHTLIVWEAGGKVRLRLAGHEQDPAWVAWSPDGKRLASGGRYDEKRVFVWDADKGKRLREMGPFTVDGKLPGQWSADGRLLAFRVHDAGWHVWEVHQNKLVNDPKEWKWHFTALTPDGRSALVWRYGFNQLQDGASGKKFGEVPLEIRFGAAWSPDERLLAVHALSGVEL